MAQQPTSSSSSSSSPIGRDTLRIDGPRKVTGLAKYASDFQFPGMLYAVPVEATIASGRLLTLDTAVHYGTSEKVIELVNFAQSLPRSF